MRAPNVENGAPGNAKSGRRGAARQRSSVDELPRTPIRINANAPAHEFSPGHLASLVGGGPPRVARKSATGLLRNFAATASNCDNEWLCGQDAAFAWRGRDRATRTRERTRDVSSPYSAHLSVPSGERRRLMSA
jgi:hypothetical protein